MYARINIRCTIPEFEMTGRDYDLWELKQAAKWSLDLSERIRAIEQLRNNFGEQAIEALSEIKETAVHDEIRSYCIEALKNAGRASVKETVIIVSEEPVAKPAAKPPTSKKDAEKKAPAKKATKVRKAQKI
jgi:hypothetical protein